MRDVLKSCVVTLLMLESRVALLRFRPRIVAITGSVGKTSTKEAITAALSLFYRVRGSEKSYNSDFGIPLTILGLKTGGSSAFLWLKNILTGFFRMLFAINYPEWLVLEVGAGKPGDIRRFGRLLSPDIVVITRFADIPVHVEFFGTPKAVAEEKTDLARALKKGRTLILGTDDPAVAALAKQFPNQRVITYGLTGTPDVQGTGYSALFASKNALNAKHPVGFACRVRLGDKEFPLEVQGTIGEHLVQPLLAAFATGKALSLDSSRIAREIGKILELPRGRMRVLVGKNDSTIIDDTYNASPVAVEAALRTLSSLEGGRKVAVLGGMAELGSFSEDEHRRIGGLAARSCDFLVTVGVLAEGIRDGACRAGMKEENTRHFSGSLEAGSALLQEIKEGDRVLVKGSQSARMEHVVKALMAEPERAGKLLVRQEKEWSR